MCTQKSLNLNRVDESDIIEINIQYENKINSIQMTVINKYQSAHIDIKNAIVFTAVQMKHYYDLKYIFKFFEPEDMMNL